MSAKTGSQLPILADKTQHLHAIHALPEECWPGCVAALIDNLSEAEDPDEKTKAWTVKEIEDRVKKTQIYLKKSNRGNGWDKYLPKFDCALAVFAGVADRWRVSLFN